MSETLVKVDRKLLADAVTRVRGATVGGADAKKMPHLAMVRLVPHGRRLTVEAADTLARLETTILAEASGPPVLADPKTLLAFLKSSRHPTVDLHANGDGTVNMALNGSTATLPTTDAESWPEGPAWETGEVLPIPENMAEGIRRVGFAASPDDSRPILCGVHFDGTTLVATDSYRLAWIGPFRPLPNMLVHAGGLVRALKHVGRHATMVVGEASVLVCGLGGSAVVPRISGEYPKWRTLPGSRSQYGHSVTFDRLQVIGALKRAEKFVGHRPYDAEDAIRLATENGTLRLSVERKAGEWAEAVPAEGGWKALAMGGQPILALDVRYLREGLEACRSERVTLAVQDVLKPVRIDDGDFHYLLMPIRVS